MDNGHSYLCLVYTSRLVRHLTDIEMDRLVEEADRNNRSNDITGVLIRSGPRIVQYLEGPVKELATLFNRINHDTRHIDVKVIHLDTVTERLFKTWNCLYRKLDDAEPQASLEVERLLKNHFRGQPALETAIADLIHKLPRTPNPD